MKQLAFLNTGSLEFAVTVQDADEGDTSTNRKTLIGAAENAETIVLKGEVETVCIWTEEVRRLVYAHDV